MVIATRIYEAPAYHRDLPGADEEQTESAAPPDDPEPGAGPIVDDLIIMRTAIISGRAWITHRARNRVHDFEECAYCLTRIAAGGPCWLYRVAASDTVYACRECGDAIAVAAGRDIAAEIAATSERQTEYRQRSGGLRRGSRRVHGPDDATILAAVRAAPGVTISEISRRLGTSRYIVERALGRCRRRRDPAPS